ncbi:hypothetical protein ACWEKT_20680 [Nocardia takedensis]
MTVQPQAAALSSRAGAPTSPARHEFAHPDGETAQRPRANRPRPVPTLTAVGSGAV